MRDGVRAFHGPHVGVKRKSPFDVSDIASPGELRSVDFNVIDEMIQGQEAIHRLSWKSSPRPLAHMKCRVRQPGDFVLVSKEKCVSPSTLANGMTRPRPSLSARTELQSSSRMNVRASSPDDDGMKFEASKSILSSPILMPPVSGRHESILGDHTNGAYSTDGMNGTLKAGESEPENDNLREITNRSDKASQKLRQGSLRLIHSDPNGSVCVTSPSDENDDSKNVGHGAPPATGIFTEPEQSLSHSRKHKSKRWSKSRRCSEEMRVNRHQRTEALGKEFDKLHREGNLRKHLYELERGGLYSAPHKALKGSTDKNGCQLISGRGDIRGNEIIDLERHHCLRLQRGTRVVADSVIRLAHVEPARISGPQCQDSKLEESRAEYMPLKRPLSSGRSYFDKEPESPKTPSFLRGRVPRRSRRLSRARGELMKSEEVIDLTHEDDSGKPVPGAISSVNFSSNNAKENGISGIGKGQLGNMTSIPGENGVVHACGPIDPGYVEPPYLSPLSGEESKLVDALTKGRRLWEPLATIPRAGITLRREDFRRLRNVRWLNDEVINAYVALINQRNQSFCERNKQETLGCSRRPRTYMFNTYFHARLVSSGYDYPGVSRWTRRSRVNVLEKDLILIPVNLGSNHWVLSGIDLHHKQFLYLDSMHKPDSADIVRTLKQWLYDEVLDKHGVAAANNLGLDDWGTLNHRYYVFCKSFDLTEVSSDVRAAKCTMLIPVQRDSGSCGVFTAKIADCLEMGIEVYFSHSDIKLIRQRMALDLYRRVLPG